MKQSTSRTRAWHRLPGIWPEYVDPRAPNPTGLCQCGCGQPTQLARKTQIGAGLFRGQPVRYLTGHQAQRFQPGYVERDCGYETPCRIWTGAIDANGYPHRGKSYEHVRVCEEKHGPMKPGYHAHHDCEQRACVHPDHIEPLSTVEHRKRHRKFSDELIEEVRRATGTTRQIALRYGISKSHVSLLRSPTYRP